MDIAKTFGIALGTTGVESINKILEMFQYLVSLEIWKILSS